MQEAPVNPIKIFYCYASRDKRLLKDLKEHLSPLKRSESISTWSTCEIQAGMDWASEIEVHLNAADIILLLVSPSFVASDLCYSVQMRRALERQHDGKARVIPVILRPTLWKETPLGALQGLPRNDRAITQWSNRDAAFLDVVIDIWVIIRDMYEKACWSIAEDIYSQQKGIGKGIIAADSGIYAVVGRLYNAYAREQIEEINSKILSRVNKYKKGKQIDSWAARLDKPSLPDLLDKYSSLTHLFTSETGESL